MEARRLLFERGRQDLTEREFKDCWPGFIRYHKRLRHLGFMRNAELKGENAGTGDEIDDEERIANAAAAEFCEPTKMMDTEPEMKRPLEGGICRVPPAPQIGDIQAGD